MSIRRIKKQVNILLHIHKNPGQSLEELANNVKIKYQNLYKKVEKYVKAGLVIKNKREPMVMGQPKFEYSLSEKAIKILKSMAQKINDTFK